MYIEKRSIKREYILIENRRNGEKVMSKEISGKILEEISKDMSVEISGGFKRRYQAEILAEI